VEDVFMSLPLFLVDQLPAGDSYVLGGVEGHHASTVQRLRVGEGLLLTDGAGFTATGTVEAVGKGTLQIKIIDRRYDPPADPRIVVAQGIAKGDRGELAVQAMTEVGVDAILPWAAVRSVTQWHGERGVRARQKWAATAREAAKQARRSWLPSMEGAPDFSTRQLAARLATATAAFVLHEEAKVALSGVALPESGEIALVVGPEGGVDPAELAVFEQAGAVPVRLGETVLRTSTAGVAALCVLATRLGRW
jgi:16S rRNA (uracil1498-N3)-methyltransferase